MVINFSHWSLQSLYLHTFYIERVYALRLRESLILIIFPSLPGEAEKTEIKYLEKEHMHQCEVGIHMRVPQRLLPLVSMCFEFDLN